jgi:hypothetical protein
MALDVYFREDILNAIRSAALATRYFQDPSFRDGYLQALLQVATSFGLLPQVERLLDGPR